MSVALIMLKALMNADLSIDFTFEKLTSSINMYGHYFQSFPRFREEIEFNKKKISLEKLSLLQESWEKYLDIIKNGPLEEETEADLNRRHLKKFLGEFGLKLGESFFSTIESGHIIEVYSKGHQQIFRSANFFDLSSYSPEVLTFVSWEKLFHRSEENFNKLLKYAEFVIEEKIGLIQPKKARHLLVEVETQRKFTHELDRIGCLLDELTGSCLGYATMIKVREVPPTIKLLH